MWVQASRIAALGGVRDDKRLVASLSANLHSNILAVTASFPAFECPAGPLERLQSPHGGYATLLK